MAELYDDLIEQIGLDGAGRDLGIRVNVDRRPTRDELRALDERSGLSVLWIDVEEGRT
jgi:hypothetical protein